MLLKRFPLSAKPHVPLRLTSRSEIACEELMAPISSFPHSKLSSAVSKALQAELQVWPALAMIQKGCTCTRLQETAEVGLYCAAYSIRSVTSHTVRNLRTLPKHNSQAPKTWALCSPRDEVNLERSHQGLPKHFFKPCSLFHESRVTAVVVVTVVLGAACLQPELSERIYKGAALLCYYYYNTL